MNPEKWDAIAEAFDAGAFVPANGWYGWHVQARCEAAQIRDALPRKVDVLVEVGCGVARLTPHLALLFPRVIACDTSSACRRVTSERCRRRRNVLVQPTLPAASDGRTYAALVWGDLYDEDWPASEVKAHRLMLRERYPVVLEGNAERWMLWSEHECVTFEA